MPCGGARRATTAAGPCASSSRGGSWSRELRGGQPIWFIGRHPSDGEARVKYLVLPGEKPILAFERAAGRREVYLVEGVFDWLTAVSWGLPAFSTCGTGFPSTLRFSVVPERRRPGLGGGPPVSVPRDPDSNDRSGLPTGSSGRASLGHRRDMDSPVARQAISIGG